MPVRVGGDFLKRPRLAKNRELRLLPNNNQALRITVKRKNMLEEELIKTGYRYSDNEDGTFDVCYDHNQDAFFSPLNGYHVASVKEDNELWYINNNEGAGWGEYPKADWTLADAIHDQCIDDHIN